MADDEYKTDLPHHSLKKAIEELAEDPKQRAGQVKALREWLSQQKHIKCSTDFYFLLKFLRTAKFSQLKARERLESYLEIFIDHPLWYKNIDLINEPKSLAFLKTGYGLILPGRNKLGQMMLLYNPNFDVKSKDFTPNSALRGLMALFFYLMMNEDAQIHGISFLFDFTHYKMAYMTYWPMDDMKQMTKLWQGRFPARMKAFHYFNPGTFLETMMAIFRPMLSKKFQDRIVVHGSNLEDVYEAFPKESLPREYLPDDYEGPCAGTYQEMVDKLIEKLTSPEINALIKQESSENVIEKGNKVQGTEQASFRKLNVD